MKAILEIPEKEFSFEFDNITINQFIMIGSRRMDVNYFMFEKYPIGKPITLITSNMPDVLKNEIENIISHYCNH